MKTKHTPAPWIIQNEDSAETVFYIQCKSGNLGSAYNKAGGEGLANAKLIAAAPELLEALLKLMEYTQQGYKGGETHPLEVAENAVRKATNLFSVQIQKATQP